MAKILYGLLFVVLLPLFLVLFSTQVENPLTIARFPIPGTILAGLGLVIMLWGMWAIWRRGRGLPMNAFPPTQLVVDGIYAVVPHPIYSGFVLVCLGASLFYGSATGVFLTTPLVALSAIALVLGYERPYLLRTFRRLPRPVLGVSNLLGPIVSALRLDRIWAGILGSTERLANSWSSRRIGFVRVINHAVFAGLAGGAGAFLVVLVAGRQQVAVVSGLMLAGVVGAAIVGQLLVGSSNGLSRPFGYFGGLLGIAIAGVVLYPFDHTMLLVLAAFAFAGPWTQAIGRLRCIVQGCCHGAPSAGDPGIVVDNEHSRVALAGLKGKRIYPTQLYSILGNLVIAAVLVWLWIVGAPLTLVGGMYLVLAGLVRFIEEGYRGEPMTKVIAGLHIYQWFAVGMLVAGLGVMMIPSQVAPPIGTSSLVPAMVVGFIFFLVCGFAMGVDFPESQRRFSRLSG
jgi:prolipoprotein diacylglyceryltransferase/protein-S-isoprenylcysteine O-methyltransferase Ste14